jgi:hypothetical protein
MRIGSAIASGARHMIGVSLQALIIAAIVVTLAFAAAAAAGTAPAGADSAFAAKGGNGHGGGNQVITTSAWVSGTPGDAKAWGGRVDINGCGFAFAPVEVRVAHPSGVSEAFMVGVWSSGCMASTYFTTQEPGLYTVEAYQASGSNGHETSSLLASTIVSVN